MEVERKTESQAKLILQEAATELSSISDKEFTENETEHLSTLANSASEAIIKLQPDAFLNSPLETDILSGLYQISQSMITEMDLQKLLEIIADKSLEFLKADIVVLYEYSEEKNDVEIPPIMKGRGIKVPDTLKERGERHQDALIFKILKRENAFYAPNAQDDWNIFYKPEEKIGQPKDDFIHREGIVSSVGIPLRVDKKPVGVLFVNYRTFCTFTLKHRIRIETFVNEAALAIRNAKIFAQRDRYITELRVLNEVVQKISSGVTLQKIEIFNLIYEQTGKLMDVSNFYVASYHSKSNTVIFEFAVENGIRQQVGSGNWLPRENGNGLTEYVIRNGNPLLIQENVDEFIDQKGLEKIGIPGKSWLGVPMISKNKILGVIAVQSPYKKNVFDIGNQTFLETIASQAAIAIETAYHIQSDQMKIDELNGLGKITGEIVSKTMDLVSVLTEILKNAVSLSYADAGQILFNDEKEGMIKVALTHNIDEMKDIKFSNTKGTAGEVLRTGKAKWTNDYFKGLNKLSELDKPIFHDLIKGIVEVPLIWQGEFLGVLAVSSKPSSKHIFDEGDVDRLKHFADSASIAMGVARYISFQQTMLDNSPDAIISVNNKGIITKFNKSSERIMGIKQDDVLGKHCAVFYCGGLNEAQRINHLLIENDKKKIPVRNIRTTVRGSNGKEIPILFSGSILRDQFNEKIGSIGLISDLRDIEFLDSEYRVQQIFLTSLEQYPQTTPINSQQYLQQRLTEILQKILYFCNLEYIILFGSTAENEMVLKAIAWEGLPENVTGELPHFNWKKAGLQPERAGEKKESILQQELTLINSWQPDQKWKDIIISGIRGGKSNFFKNISCGMPGRLADNYRATLVFGPFKEENTPAKWEEKADFIRTIAQTVNIYALSWLQTLYLRSINKEAERSQDLTVHRTRMLVQQLLDKFLAIKRGLGEGSPLKDFVADSEKLAVHLSKVVSKALTAHIVEMEPEDFDFQSYPLPAFIGNCAENAKGKAIRKKTRIIIDENIEKLPYAEIDHLMLSIALANLIENALKYSVPGGEIFIFSKMDVDNATIIVQNYGERMPEEARENLVMPGKRWGMSPRARSIPGSGFGLWDASVIVAAHGGHLDFSSLFESKKKAYNVKVWMTIPFKKNSKKLWR